MRRQEHSTALSLICALTASVAFGCSQSQDDVVVPVDAVTEPAATCNAARQIVLPAAGKAAKTRASTKGAANPFGEALLCGGQAIDAMRGPLHLYRVTYAAGKSYRVSFTPQYYLARLALFRARCDIKAMNADCKSKGTSGHVTPLVHRGKTHTFVFSPKDAGEYFLAVGSADPAAFGLYYLEQEQIAIPANGRCASAQALIADTAGGATVSASTLGATNEFGSRIECGEAKGLLGPQLYYLLVMTPGKTYRVELQAKFAAISYVFRNSCDAAAIKADCGSHGATGGFLSSGSYYHRAEGAAARMAVGSRREGLTGSFQLKVAMVVAPENDRCKKAKAVLVSDGKSHIDGSTKNAVNEFSDQVTCGMAKGLVGPQVYYEVMFPEARTYRITLTPEFEGGRLLVFSGACDAAGINKGCASGGTSGLISPQALANKPTAVNFKVGTPAAYRLAVDSTGESGTFAIDIEGE